MGKKQKSPDDSKAFGLSNWKSGAAMKGDTARQQKLSRQVHG